MKLIIAILAVALALAACNTLRGTDPPPLWRSIADKHG